MGGGISKRIGLFFLIFGVPLLFFLILSRGEPATTKLKFYGEKLTDKGVTKINDFIFYDVDSNKITKSNYKGKTLIVNVLIPSCPSHCTVMQSEIDRVIYKDKITKETRLRDFVMLSHLIDTLGNEVDLASFVNEQKNLNPEKWRIVKGNSRSLYDFNINGKNLLTNNAKNFAVGGHVFHEMVLLIDKDYYLRGIYQGDEPMEIRRLSQELNVLEREYAAKKRDADKLNAK